MTPRRVFYSFHYGLDHWRVSTVRNIGVVEGNRLVSDNEWENIKHGGDEAIKRWINEQMSGKSCAVVLIGSTTAGRKWVTYEIEQAWNDGKGVVGIHIHNLLDRNRMKSRKGANPFDHLTMQRDESKLSSIVRAYDPPYTLSTDVYRHISNNLHDWVEEAIRIRNNY